MTKRTKNISSNNFDKHTCYQISHTPPPGIGYMTYVKMVKCIRISVIDIGVKSPKAGIAHPSGVPKFILGFSGVSVIYLQIVLFSISLFVFLSVFLAFFDLRILITPLVSSTVLLHSDWLV